VAGDPQFGGDALHGTQHAFDMLVERDPQLFHKFHVFMAVDRCGEGLVFPFLFDRFELDPAQVTVRAHVGRSLDQAGQFVAGQQRLVEQRDAWGPQKGRVCLDCLEQGGRVTKFPEEPQFGARVSVDFVRHVGKAFVVQIVQQPSDSPERFVLAKMAGIDPQRGFDRQHVPTQTLRLYPLTEQGICFLTGW